MKIVCDSCGAKYSIADEKVQGKVFKIRCKKCSNVIVVKGTAEAEGAASDEGLGAGAGAAEWYVVIDGEQVGPVTTVEIDSYFMSGKINAETYAWKDGMGDWQHIVEIPEFAHLGSDVAGPNEATTIADSGHRYEGETDATNVVQSPLAMGDAGGDDYSDPGYGEDDYGYAASEDDGGYSGFANSYDGGGLAGLGGDLAATGGDDDAGAGMFAAFDTAGDSDFMSFGDEPAPATNGSNGSNGSHGAGAGAGAGAAVGADMVGQRNENSVLFSLSSLDSVPAVGDSGKSDAPVTEGSGLIDIQALASAHKSMSGSAEADGGGGIDPFAQGTMAMPALMPMGSHKSNNTLYIALAVGGIAILGLMAMGGYMIFAKDDKPQEQQVKVVERVIEKVVQGEPAPSNTEEIAKEADEAEKAIADAEPKKPEGSEEEEETSKDEAKKPAAAKRNTRRKKTEDKDPEPEPAPKPRKKKDGIDSLLDKIDEKGKAAAPKESSGSSKKSLSRNDVKQTINRYNSRINTCARSQNKSGKKGTVKVKFYIRPNGRVRGAQVVSSGFRGTDVGGCVQTVVGSMTFPKTAASKDVPVTYPFILK